MALDFLKRFGLIENKGEFVRGKRFQAPANRESGRSHGHSDDLERNKPAELSSVPLEDIVRGEGARGKRWL